MFRQLFFLLVLAPFWACDDALLAPPASDDPEACFEAMWSGFDQWYGLFPVKEVDWEETYRLYRPQVHAGTTAAELKSIFRQMIDPLNDNHTYIVTTDREPRIESGIFDTLLVQTDFSLDVIPAYVPDLRHYGAALDYGTTEGQIGYLHVGDFIPSRTYMAGALDEMLAELADTRGLIIDIRDNPGGHDAVAQYVAGRFAAGRYHYMTVRKKSGPGPHDFSQAIPWWVEPTGGTRYTRPIILLTSRWTESAGETFALAMRELPHVTQVGDVTSGGFSDNIARELPNGWFCFMSIGDYRASDGQSYEGVGLAPDVRCVTTKADLQAGWDRALEKAIGLLQ